MYFQYVVGISEITKYNIYYIRKQLRMNAFESKYFLISFETQDVNQSWNKK